MILELRNTTVCTEPDCGNNGKRGRPAQTVEWALYTGEDSDSGRPVIKGICSECDTEYTLKDYPKPVVDDNYDDDD